MTRKEAERAYRKYIRAKYNLKRNEKIKIDERAVTSLLTYNRRYKEQAVKVETGLRFARMSHEKKRLLDMKKDLASKGLLNKETRKALNSQIKANTLSKETRKEIRRSVMREKDLTLRDKKLTASQFFPQYESTKRQLEEEGIKGDPMQYIVRQQAYTLSIKQYQALKEARSKEITYEEGEFEEDIYYTPPEERIFKEEFDEISEIELRTGEVALEDVIDFDKVKAKYHELKEANPNWDSYELKKEIGQLYWGS